LERTIIVYIYASLLLHMRCRTTRPICPHCFRLGGCVVSALLYQIPRGPSKAKTRSWALSASRRGPHRGALLGVTGWFSANHVDWTVNPRHDRRWRGQL